MTEYYNYIKSLHLIFVITWFAGLFYIPRLFIYHIESNQKPSPEKEILSKQLKLMTKRLWFIITWPSAILAIFFAIWLLVIYPGCATLILFAIVFLVILKHAFNWIFGIVGIIVLGILLMIGIKLYKRIRNKNSEA